MCAPGIWYAIACIYRAVGSASISERDSVSGWDAFSTSTVATRASMLIVSPTAPTLSVASTVAVTSAGRTTDWTTAEKPSAEAFTTYSPGRKSTMEYRPSPLVVTVRDFSIRTSLVASTDAPATTAPLASLITPEIVLCAIAREGKPTRASDARRLLNRLPFIAERSFLDLRN